MSNVKRFSSLRKLGAVTDVVEVYAELTTIPAERMFSLDGVVGVSS
jgi:hypothetical protein